MPSSFYPQCITVLFDRSLDLAQLKKCFSHFEIVGENAAPEQHWSFTGPNISIPYRPDSNGFILLDIVNHVWPDEMGDPDTDSQLFSAWSLGQFGSLCYPGALRRASEQSWTWEAAKETAYQHKAFVRLRSCYLLDLEDGDTPNVPDDYDAVEELSFLTDLAEQLLKLPGSLCFFSPCGEVLRDLVCLTEDVERMRVENLPPFEVWSNVRIFKMDDGWVLMDTVGNQQFGQTDFEACFPEEKFDPEEVHLFLRQLTLYQMESPTPINDGDSTDGPAGLLWQAREIAESMVIPPRSVLRWTPDQSFAKSLS